MTYAGINVSKAWLDLAPVGPTLERRFRFANNEAGRSNLVRALRQHAPAWVVVEPGGLYHLPLLRLLVTQGFKVALANPYQVAPFRRAGGKRNKTDAFDALLLAHFALVYRDALVPHRPLPLKLARLKRMVVYREQLSTNELPRLKEPWSLLCGRETKECLPGSGKTWLNSRDVSVKLILKSPRSPNSFPKPKY